MNFTFADLWGGNIISSVKYSTTTSYDLGITTKAIIETFSSEIGITAGYSKSGFERPLFGLFLKNDIFYLSYFAPVFITPGKVFKQVLYGFYANFFKHFVPFRPYSLKVTY